VGIYYASVCFHPSVTGRLGTRRSAMPIGAGVVLLSATVSWLMVVHLSAPSAQRLVDLDVYRQAGRSVLDGRDVYAFLAHPPQRLPFTYPPFAALLAVPLAVVPFGVLGVVWTLAEIACTVAITWLGFRALLPRFGRWAPLALGVLAGLMQQMLPLRDEIKFGQVDELLVLLCAVDCLLLPRRRAHGALIGIATAVKLTPGVFVVYLLVAGRRRAAAVATAVFCAATALSAAVLPRDSRSFWTDALWHSERLRANDGTSNQSLRGMWLRAAGEGSTSTALWLLSVVLVAVVGFVVARTASRAEAELTAVAVVGLLAVLLSPVAWIHHLCWLPLVLGAVVTVNPTRRRVAVVVGVWLFYVLKVPWWGSHLVHHPVPRPLARIVQDGFGLAALALVATAPVWGMPRRTTLARRGASGHNAGGQAAAARSDEGEPHRDETDPAAGAAAGRRRSPDAPRRRPG
jgi:alpha-1,2-mannosyltransferase